jgi:tetratricopeptide (TPR) repeat protein
VTLGRALVELQQFSDAQRELEQVLQSAPENLAAIRGLADVLHRQGALAEALAQYRAALAIARHDPDLEQTIDDLSRQVEPKPSTHAVDGLSFEQAAKEFLIHAPAPPVVDGKRAHALVTVAALEQLLTAVHVARAERRA